MAGSRRGTADWHFATGHFGRKRAIRRRGGGGTPAAGTEPAGGTDEPAAKRRDGSEKEGRQQRRKIPAAGTGAGRRRGCTGGDAGVPAAKRRGGSRKGKTPADGTGPADRAAEEELRLRAQGGSAERQRRCTGRWHGGRSTGRQRRNTGRWHKAGRRNSRGGAGGRGGVPAASARRVSGTAEKVRTEEEHRPEARRAAAHKKACAAAGPYPEVRTTLFIIGSVRRGYALQRRESSCRPT